MLACLQLINLVNIHTIMSLAAPFCIGRKVWLSGPPLFVLSGGVAVWPAPICIGRKVWLSGSPLFVLSRGVAV